MPSNQRPLTRPRHKSSGSGGVAFVAAAPLVLRAGSALTLFCTIFLGASILFTLRSPDDVASAGKRFEGYVAGGFKSATSSMTKSACKPLRLPGWINAAGTTPMWETFDSVCPSSHIVASLASSPGTPASPLLDAKSSLELLSNRTILVVADAEPTQARLAHLCQVLQGTTARVDVGHPWGTPLQRASADDAKLTMGSYCYVAKNDLLIYHFPHAGLASTVEARMAALLPPLLSSWSSPSSSSLPSLPKTRRRRSPDLAIWSSYTNDLAAINEGDKNDRLNWWRKRNLEALQQLKASLGGGKIMWMSPGYGDAALGAQAISSTSHFSAAQDSLLHGNPTDRFLSSTIPYSHRLSSSSSGWFAGDVPWRRISAGIEAATSSAPLRGGQTLEGIEAAMWGETVLGSLADIV